MIAKKFHIRKSGDPGECRAEEGSCPLDRGKAPDDKTPHFATPESAMSHYESIMGKELFVPPHDFEAAEKMRSEAKYFALALDDDPELLPPSWGLDAAEDDDEEDGYVKSMTEFKHPKVAMGQCGIVAETVKFADKRFGEISQDCDGPELNLHVANTFTDNKGREWVVDYTYSQIDPHAEWPYVGTREDWVEKVKGSGYTTPSELVAAYEGNEDDSYKMSHQPDEDGALGYDVEEYFPDFYARPQIYPSGYSSADKEAIAVMQSMRGNPEAEVTLYRAVPDKKHGIRPGNWVTLSKLYAQAHAGQFDSESSHGDPENYWSIVELKVKAKDIRTPGDSIQEWGYFPEV